MDRSAPFQEIYARCVADDDESAWAELIRRFDPWVAAVAHNALRLLDPGHAGLAEVQDLRQETWYRLLRGGRRAVRDFPDRSEDELRAYLRTIAVNVVRDRLKARSMQKRPRIAALSAEALEGVLQRAVDDAPGPDEEAGGRVMAERIAPLLRRVWSERPRCERDIVICQLYLVDGFSAARIAAIESLGLSRGGVEKVVERGRRVLQEHFGGPGARSRLVDDGRDEPPPQGGWKDVDEILAFVVGDLDPETTAARTALLARDPRARRALVSVVEALERPLDAARLRTVLEPPPETLLARRRPGVRGRRSWTAPLAAVAAVLLLLVVRPSAPPPAGPARPDLSLPYPPGVAAPLRMVQPFRPEAPGPVRGGGVLSTQDEERMDLVEQELLLERSRGGDPVATSNALGHLKLARGRLDLAARNYAVALRHDPDNAEALLGLAVVKWRRAADAEASRRRDLLEEADRTLQRIPSASPHYAVALYDRVQLALALGEVDRALALLHRYEGLAPRDGWWRALQAAVERADRG